MSNIIKKNTCPICPNRIEMYKFKIRDLLYCKECLHISSSNKRIINFHDHNTQNTENTKNINKKISDLCVANFNTDDKINILDINNSSTLLLDQLKYSSNIKTVSVSPHFNPRFLSKHDCYKNTFDNLIIETLEQKYNNFDFIIINNTLSFLENPSSLLSLLQKISHPKTVIVSININSNILLKNTRDTHTRDINVKHISNFFNTNSMNLLCKKNNMTLNSVEIIVNNYSIFEIINNYKPLQIINYSIVESLYSDILNSIYDVNQYEIY